MNHIVTSHGNLGADIKTTYHIDWLTYSYKKDKGVVGLENIAEKTFGVRIEFGSSNDTDYSVNLKKKKLTDFKVKELNDIIKHAYMEDYQLSLVMTEMCNRDVLPEGSYVVNVSW